MATSAEGAQGQVARGGRVSVGRLARAWLLVVALSAVINVLIAYAARAVLDVSGGFAPFQPFTIIASTALFMLVATLVFAVIVRRSRRPVRTWQIVAGVALLLSLSNPFFILGSDSPRFSEADGAVAATLMLMHVVAGVIAVGVFSGLARAVEKP